MIHFKKLNRNSVVTSTIFFLLLSFTSSSNAGLFGKLKLRHLLPGIDKIESVPGVSAIISGDLCGADPICNNTRATIKNCIVDANDNACATTLLLPNFNTDCKLVGGLLAQWADYKSDWEFGDLARDRNLDAAIAEIFEVRLKSPGFVKYVHENVHYYYSRGVISNGGSSAGSDEDFGKTSRQKIFFSSPNPSNSLIMHELVHVWQYYYHGAYKFENEFCDNVAQNGEIPTYEFIMDPARKFLSYGPEQQGEIVQTYYQIKYDSETTCNGGNLGYILNCSSAPYNGNTNLVRADLEKIIGTVPSNVITWLIPVLSLLNS
jgi:hypothetical protein